MADWRGESGPTERPDLYRSCFHSRNEMDCPLASMFTPTILTLKDQEKDGYAQSRLADKSQIAGLEANNEVTTSSEG